jgi:hypothetical protein
MEAWMEEAEEGALPPLGCSVLCDMYVHSKREREREREREIQRLILDYSCNVSRP